MSPSAPSIHDACRRGDIERVRKLVAENPKLVDADDEHKWRPIFHAGLNSQEEVVRFLIAAGADVSAHDGDALHYASEVPNNKSIVRLLVQYGALDAHVRPVDDLSRQFLAAVFLADNERVGSLLRAHPHLATTADGRGDMPLHHAARNGDLDIVRQLIAAGADVNATNARGHTVLYCAGGHGHAAVVQLALKHGAEADVRFTHDGENLLQWLAQYPDDQRFAKVAVVINEHKSRG